MFNFFTLCNYPSVDETITLESLFALITLITGRIIDNKNNTNNNDLYPPEKLTDDIDDVKSLE